MTTLVKPVHEKIYCDECGIPNIVGIRYKCGNCVDYDVCGSCIAYTQHDKNNHHAFVMIKRPVHLPKDMPPLLTRIVYDQKEESSPPSLFTTFGSKNSAPLTEHKQGPLFASLVEAQKIECPFAFTSPYVYDDSNSLFSNAPLRFGTVATKAATKPFDNVSGVF